ncbi:hydrolase [Arthrobacter sp. B2a2-09]|uniref:hydrolase n=1 Tax=Arthrobacter sp. B2a2-09 TaxID=2952822 RepID=UPI0022CD912E|nr:hydrolase [Arthrobacter sp. B2a2-09]MCZ9881732.1 hydrolase [Arthrobacter sp. B2a2-09]
MTSEPRRDPLTDNLLTPENSALLLIDYQPTQVQSINSIDRAQLIRNVATTVKLARTFDIPIVLSTVNVATGRNKGTIPALADLLTGVPSLDRTSINAWEDVAFRAAVSATARKKLIIAALWTEACLTFPTLDALREGFEVFPVVDAVGGTSVIAHETAITRVTRAGAQPVSIAQLACELQRDWNRTDTVQAFVDELTEAGIFLKLG